MIQSCGSCIGARGVLERFVAGELEAVADLTDRAARLERRKERPHRVAKMIEQAIELRIEAAQRSADVRRAQLRLAQIPTTDRCPMCAGRGTIVPSGTFLLGVA